MHLHSPPSLREISADCPCIGHCSTALGDDVCRGCGRTLEEIIAWPRLTEEERRVVNRRIALERRNHLNKSTLPNQELIT